MTLTVYINDLYFFADILLHFIHPLLSILYFTKKENSLTTRYSSYLLLRFLWFTESPFTLPKKMFTPYIFAIDLTPFSTFLFFLLSLKNPTSFFCCIYFFCPQTQVCGFFTLVVFLISSPPLL
jgi:hypothetical protein